MKPSIGRIVVYNTTEKEREEMKNDPERNISEKLPAIIVAVWSDDCVNLKVFQDGLGDKWATSSLNGDEEGRWNWPPRV